MKDKEKVEKIIFDSFLNEPFHNLYHIYDIKPKTYRHGGTCSEKTLSVYNNLKSEDISVKIWSAMVDGNETHRVLKIFIESGIYFADVGNAWPSIKMFPEKENFEYESYGITFKSVLDVETLDIYNCRDGREILSVSIILDSKSEEEIFKDIENRFSSDIDYPFKNHLRFAKIIGDKFYFLRDETVHVYSEKDSYKIDVCISDEKDLERVLMKYFNFDLNRIKEQI